MGWQAAANPWIHPVHSSSNFKRLSLFRFSSVNHYWLVVWNIFIFPYIGNNHPSWLIFFRGVQTTNQIIMKYHGSPMLPGSEVFRMSILRIWSIISTRDLIGHKFSLHCWEFIHSWLKSPMKLRWTSLSPFFMGPVMNNAWLLGRNYFIVRATWVWYLKFRETHESPKSHGVSAFSHQHCNWNEVNAPMSGQSDDSFAKSIFLMHQDVNFPFLSNKAQFNYVELMSIVHTVGFSQNIVFLKDSSPNSLGFPLYNKQ